MSLDAVQIHTFIQSRFHTPPIQKIVDSWRIEPEVLIEKLVEFFRDAGIYSVPHGHEAMILSHMIRELRHAPEIKRLVAKARNEEMRRQRNRHAD